MSSGSSKLNVLLIGSGGREHALAWKLKQSPTLGKLYTTHPGNPGIAALAEPMGFEFNTRELYRVEQFCRHASIDLVVVGPEGPLSEGIADKLANEKVAVFGPTKEAAQLESDKAWSKQLMRGASIPTAEARVFRDPTAAKSYLESRDEPVVIKAAGLAAGKGVILPSTLDEAFATIDRIMVKKEFGDAGNQVVIEEKLSGPEVSVFALTDGRTITVLDPCQDFKRIGEGDTGPNTGGMGAYCPCGVIDKKTMQIVERDILVPTVDAIRREGLDYKGVLYAGLMLTHGGPKVLEFNVRFGDPECQCLVRRLDCDLVKVLHGVATGKLQDVEIDSHSEAVVCVVLASAGYPGDYTNGKRIDGIAQAEQVEGVTVFHAGTAREKDGTIVTNGGRVLNVVATGRDIAEARERANRAAEMIHFEGKQYRRDIALAATQPPAAHQRTGTKSLSK